MLHHDSDHRALILRLEADPAGVKRYDKTRRTLPAPPLPRPLARGDAMFEELVDTLEKPPTKERPENALVRTGTWHVDSRGQEGGTSEGRASHPSEVPQIVGKLIF